MNALLKLDAAMLTMSSPDLLEFVNEARAEFGESPVRHNDFVTRCKDELDGEPYETFVEPPQITATGRIPAFEAIRMTPDQCKLVAMRESKGVRRRVLEKLNAKSAPTVPKTMAQALRLAAEQAEQIEQQQAQLVLAAPKVEYVDRYVAANGAMGFRQVAKLLKANESEFRAWLQESKVMYRLGGEWAAYQCHIDAGRFVTKAGVATHNEHAYSRTLFTPKGANWIAGEWAKHQLALATAKEVAC